MINNQQEEFIQSLVDKHYFSLGKQEIFKFNDCNNSGELNNVIVGLDRHCYGVFLTNDTDRVKYQLLYVNADKGLKGDLLQLTADLKHRDGIVLWFSGYLARTYSNLDLVDVYNTYQKHTRGMLEKLGYTTISTEEMEKFEGCNPELIGAKSKGVFVLRMLNKVDFYKDFFKCSGQVLSVEKNKTNHIYLLLNRRNNLFKIGRSKTPTFREKTLQAQEPEIDMIIAWEAPVTMERHLHRLCKRNRVRGEWFSLSFKELNLIRDEMEPYNGFIPDEEQL